METEDKDNSFNNNLILVYYIDVRKISNEEIPEFMNRVMNNIKLTSSGVSEIIALPILNDSRVECINPKYITEMDLIREHRLKMDELQELLEKQINEFKNG